MKALKPFFLISLILSLTLSGCVSEKPFEEVVSYWTAPTALYGNQRQFEMVSQPDYVKETVVYQVAGDMELALLAKLQFDQGVTQFYVTDKDFSINKTYAYLEALMIHAFKFSMGTKTYTKGDTVVKTLDYVKIEPYNDKVNDVDQAIDTFIGQRVNTTETIPHQIKALHDGLILSTQYDTDVLQIDLTNITDHTPFEAYGLFINHKAVCSGYAKAFVGLAIKLNIPALTVSSTTMNHAWNMVYTGSAWRYVDATWDDPIPDKSGRVLDNYLLLDLKTLTTNSSTIKAHTFDQSGESTLSAADYLAFAEFVYPYTKP